MNVLKQQWISLVILTLLVQPMLVLGQTSDKTNWSNVTSLPAGTSVSVKTKSGKNLDGTVNTVSDTAIVVLQNGITVSADRSDVKKVYQVTRDGSKGKAAALGAGIGAGAGLGVGFIVLAATGGSDETGKVLAPFIAVGAGIGAALGLGIGGRKKALVYEVK